MVRANDMTKLLHLLIYTNDITALKLHYCFALLELFEISVEGQNFVMLLYACTPVQRKELRRSRL